MTTQIVNACVVVNGEIVTLQSTLTDATAGELKTSGTVGAGGGISATSIGTYAAGKTLTAFISPVMTNARVQWAYLSRRGEILRVFPIGKTEIINDTTPIKPVVLQPGDSIQVMVGVATADLRQVNYNVICNDGTEAIFSAQPGTGTSGSVSLTHILSGQGLGQSLSGRSVISHFASSGEGSRYAGGALFLVNDRGLPSGACVCINPEQVPIRFNSTGLARIELNWEALIVLIA